MSDNPFEPGAAVFETGAGLDPRFEPPRTMVTYALYGSAASDAIQIPMFLASLEDRELLWSAVAILQVTMLLACAVLWCMWTYRAALNARVLSDGPFEFTPGWAVGWYFVPFLNLVRPYQAMKEIWLNSIPGAGEHPTADTSLLGAWWASWIISNVISNFSTRIESQFAVMLAAVAGVISALIATRLVANLNATQIEAARLRSSAA